jgi:hypothetical protein
MTLKLQDTTIENLKTQAKALAREYKLEKKSNQEQRITDLQIAIMKQMKAGRYSEESTEIFEKIKALKVILCVRA